MAMYAFEHSAPEARGLLTRRIRDLGLKLQGSRVERYIDQLYRELGAKGLKRFRPPCYLSDEWACPDREPIIGIPFYLADSKLTALEDVEDVESEREILMYLRHEAGHAFNYAYQLYETREWHELFGPFDRPYRDDFQPVPFARSHVRHIAGWYAQKHPDDDFAETFAVWLTPRLNWRRRYQGWGALKKLEYVDRTARELADREPLRPIGKAELPVEEMQATVEEYFRAQERDETQATADLPLDVDLEDLFVPPVPGATRPAAEFLVAYRKQIVDRVTYWTGVRRSLTRRLVDAMVRRVKEMELAVETAREADHLVEVVAYVTTLAMNYLTRGRFTEK